MPSEPHKIYFNITFVKPSQLKIFIKHQICCHNNQGRAERSGDARDNFLIVPLYQILVLRNLKHTGI